MTCTDRLTCSSPASGPLSKLTRTWTAPFCSAGTRTEAPQNVPQAKPVVAELSSRPPSPSSAITPWQPASYAAPWKAPR